MVGKAKLTPDQVRELVKRYKAGETLTELARAYQVAFSAVRFRLKGAGVKMRSPDLLDMTRMRKASNLRMAGKTLAEIGKELGVTKQRIHAMLKAYDKRRGKK